MNTLVALYDRLDEAELAVRELQSSGIARDDINLIAGVIDQDIGAYFDEKGRYRTDSTHEQRHEGEATKEAGAGLSIGSLIAGLSLLTIPGVGPLLAAGPLAAGVAAAGPNVAGEELYSTLHRAGVAHRDAELFQEGVRRGGALILVTAREAQAASVATILARHQPADLAQRARTWEREVAEQRSDSIAASNPAL